MQTTTALRIEPRPFVIETGIPIPKRGQPPSDKIRESLTRLTYAINNMKKGQSIVSMNVSATTIRKYMRETLPEKEIRLQVINKEKGMVRLWLMA